MFIYRALFNQSCFPPVNEAPRLVYYECEECVWFSLCDGLILILERASESALRKERRQSFS